MYRQLLKEEQIVLELVQEYIEEHQFFSVDAIIPFISSRFANTSTNISIQGIRTILESLIKKNHIIDGSILTREGILLNKNRKKIYDFIIRNPGEYFYRIVKKTKLNNPVVEWHLNILLKFNFIKKGKIENQEVYFKAGNEQELDETVYLIRKDKSKKIITYFLHDNDGVTKTRIAKELNMHYKTINKYFEKLERMCILDKKKLSNMTIFFLNKELWLEKYALYYNFQE